MSRRDNYVTIKILFFAIAREYSGKKEVLVEVPRLIGGKDLLHFISEKYNLNNLKCNLILAVNENWIDLNCDLSLQEADEIAVIPPLSGVSGSKRDDEKLQKYSSCLVYTFSFYNVKIKKRELHRSKLFKMDSIKLTADKLSIESICSTVCSPEYGAVSVFIGTTRNSFEGKPVSKLEYEAYEKMAIKSLEKICQNVRKKFEVGNIAIFHRLGDVPIQEASVIIAISSAHRKPALEAVPYVIDALKANVPIWKKEIYQDGKASEWKENSESEDAISSDNAMFVQLYEEVVEAESGNEVPPHLIQINANLQEVNRRINSFINRKREQINASNVQDFCLESSENTDESTCARVSAVLMRRKDSKSHLKVHRVRNSVGPQTHGFDPASHVFSPETLIATPSRSSGAEERLANAERYLNINPTSRDVFSRLKAIEDKLLYLESVSPEYFGFDVNMMERENPKQKHGSFPCKRIYTSSDLDVKMRKLEAKLQQKSNCLI